MVNSVYTCSVLNLHLCRWLLLNQHFKNDIQNIISNGQEDYFRELGREKFMLISTAAKLLQPHFADGKQPCSLSLTSPCFQVCYLQFSTKVPLRSDTNVSIHAVHYAYTTVAMWGGGLLGTIYIYIVVGDLGDLLLLQILRWPDVKHMPDGKRILNV